MSDISLVLSADNYQIPDEKTGEIQNLFQVWYINEYRVSSEREHGSKPIKTLVTAEVYADLVKHPLPSLFDLQLRSRPGKGNAPTLTVVGFQFLSTPAIFPAPVSTAKKVA